MELERWKAIVLIVGTIALAVYVCLLERHCLKLEERNEALEESLDGIEAEEQSPFSDVSGRERQGFAKRIDRLQKEVGSSQDTLLKMQDEVDALLNEMTSGEVVGENGATCVRLLDCIGSAEESISGTVFYLKQAREIINGDK